MTRSSIALGLLASCLGACDAPGPAPALAASAPALPPSAAPAAPPSPTPEPAACPEGMVAIPGGAFKVGNAALASAPEEMPAFETNVAAFCMDVTEVTTAAYSACVQSGKCTASTSEGRFCNARLEGRGDHPMNCVDWKQSSAFCEARGARLPSEVEWEYAARGGSEYRAFSWGSEPPDGRTCWKHVGGSCRVKEFPAGAFGLYDMIGNVWEWTDDWFGDYPWPPESGTNKVYRGGSWSRRFVKWMSPRLRNRWPPAEQGSHLGFRCALTLPDTACPYGRSADGKRCRHGVTGVSCPGRAKWNGVRCAAPGEPECPPGRDKREGHGCVLALDVKGPLETHETTPISRARTPEFDADCQKNKPGRPNAYRYGGGTHHGRNRESGAAGCSNRDVGVGWNSTCCP